MLMSSPLEIQNSLPLSLELKSEIETYRNEIRSIIAKPEARFALIVGPCSLHDIDSTIEYAKKIATLQHLVEKNCLLIMRAHIEKPRTGQGWKGLLYDPLLDASNDMALGLTLGRHIFLEIAKLHVPIATEFLDPIASLYFSDLVSWGFIGARTSSSQTHRQLASLLPMPIGFKNTTDGNLENAIQGALFAQHSHTFLHLNEKGQISAVKSPGNNASHIVLRGSNKQPNYEASKVKAALDLSSHYSLDKKVLIDCAHGNSRKNPFHQKIVCKSILDQHSSGNKQIMGMMVESHLESGSQSFSSLINPSISITDPCLGWSLTEELILSINHELSNNASYSLV